MSILLYPLGSFLRSFGRSIESVGAGLRGKRAKLEFRELNRHQRVLKVGRYAPEIQEEVFVAPNALVAGSVKLSERSAVGFGSCLRGDFGEILIGFSSTIGDQVFINPSFKAIASHTKVEVGDFTSIGSGSIIFPSKIGSETVIAPRTKVLTGAEIGSLSIVDYGSVVAEGQKIPSGQLWRGSPATFVRNLTEEEQAVLRETARTNYATYLRNVFQPEAVTDAERNEIIDYMAIGKKSQAYVDVLKDKALAGGWKHPVG